MKKWAVLLLCSVSLFAQQHTFVARDTNNVFTGTNTFNLLVLSGSNSGSATIVASADASSPTLTLPTTTGTLALADTPNSTIIGTSTNLSPPRQYFICTGTCTVTPPVPAAGYEFCIMNDDNVTTVITLAALGSSAQYEATARTSYGTAGTGTLVSNGAAGNKVCLLGRDSTHYLTVSFTGTWTAN